MCTVPPTVLQKFLSALSSLAFVWCFHFLFFICCTTGICHNMAILSPVSVHLTWPMRLVLVHTPKPVINVVPIVSVHWFMNKTYTVCGTDFSNGSRCLCSKYTKSVQFFFFFFFLNWNPKSSLHLCRKSYGLMINVSGLGENGQH